MAAAPETRCQLVGRLEHGPLKPSTYQWLTSRGYGTVQEIQRTVQQGGLSLLALECGCSCAQAGQVWQEVTQAFGRTTPANMTTDHRRSSPHSAALPPPPPSAAPLPSVSGTWSISSISAAALLRQQQQQESTSSPTARPRAIVTCARAVDQLCRGGIPLASGVTELVGPPGVGKTQFALQVAVSTTLPQRWGGVQGQVLLVDTEGGFLPERMQEMAQALIDHVQSTTLRRKRKRPRPLDGPPPPPSVVEEAEDPGWQTTAEDILQSIHVYRVHDVASLLAVLLGAIPQFLQQQQQQASNEDRPVRCIVVDSLAMPFRAQIQPNYLERTRILSQIATTLSALAQQYHLAVLVTNHVVMTGSSYSISSTWLPSASSSSLGWPPGWSAALGETWSHQVTTRLLLLEAEGDAVPRAPNEAARRWCRLIKSPCWPPGQAEFVLVRPGLRGVEFLQQRSSSRTGPSLVEKRVGGGTVVDDDDDDMRLPPGLKILDNWLMFGQYWGDKRGG